MTRGLLTIAAVRARCIVNHDTGCWHWQGAMSTDGTPRIWTFDHERGEKRTMSGPKAVWNIAHQEAPRKGWLVYRRCVVDDCLCPVHLAQARDRIEIGRHIAGSGRRKGTAVESRRANAIKAQMAAGIVVTSPDIVRACRAAPEGVTSASLSKLYGIAPQTVSRIRRGESHQRVSAHS